MPNMTNRYHNRRETLEATGTDTTNYFALHIAKGDIPEGAEIVIQVRDKETGKMRSLDVSKPEQRRKFAQNSHFHGQVMADGHVFNPYIHRRFIAVQFKALVMRFGVEYLEDSVAREYDWDYAIKFLRKEAHKLANLEQHDTKAYAERAMFFDKNVIADILDSYALRVSTMIDTRSGTRPIGSFYVPGLGTVSSANIRPTKYRFTKLANDVRACTSMKQVDALLNSFNWLALDKCERLPQCFVRPFIEAGAYFTLKHRIMFEGMLLPRKNQTESLAALRVRGGTYLMLYSQLT